MRFRNGDNYPGNYWRYLRAVENGETPNRLPDSTMTCHFCGREFSSGRARNKHVRSRKCQ